MQTLGTQMIILAW